MELEKKNVSDICSCYTMINSDSVENVYIYKLIDCDYYFVIDEFTKLTIFRGCLKDLDLFLEMINGNYDCVSRMLFTIFEDMNGKEIYINEHFASSFVSGHQEDKLLSDMLDLIEERENAKK